MKCQHCDKIISQEDDEVFTVETDIATLELCECCSVKAEDEMDANSTNMENLIKESYAW